jgi:hypothetical protein
MFVKIVVGILIGFLGGFVEARGAILEKEN